MLIKLYFFLLSWNDSLWLEKSGHRRVRQTNMWNSMDWENVIGFAGKRTKRQKETTMESMGAPLTRISEQSQNGKTADQHSAFLSKLQIWKDHLRFPTQTRLHSGSANTWADSPDRNNSSLAGRLRRILCTSDLESADLGVQLLKNRNIN